MLAREIPLLEQFVYDLGDSVIDRVAEAPVSSSSGGGCRSSPGRAAGWR